MKYEQDRKTHFPIKKKKSRNYHVLRLLYEGLVCLDAGYADSWHNETPRFKVKNLT